MFEAHMWVLFLVLLVSVILMLRLASFKPAPAAQADTSGYFDEVVKYGTVATMFWGIVGFLVGVVAAAQLAFPDLNIEPWFNFGRVRPLHTSAVIFAFWRQRAAGDVLLRGAAHDAGAPVGRQRGLVRVLGYQLFIVMAATGYLLGITQSKEYAEPEWYVDLWSPSSGWSICWCFSAR